MQQTFKVFNLTALTTASVLYLIGTTDLSAQGRQNCGPRDVVISRLAEGYGESRQTMGLGGDDTVVEMYASRETGSWTITVTMPDGDTCLVASGLQFEALAEVLPTKGKDI